MPSSHSNKGFWKNIVGLSLLLFNATHAIKNGRLSATRDDKGRYLIDPAELFRVYPPYDGRTDEKTDFAHETARPSYDVLEYKIESLEQQLQREKELNRELARRLDDESLERRKLTALLTYQAEKKTSNGGELWQKVFKEKQH